MFNLGDFAEIRVDNRTRSFCMPDSPALNLEGTIVKIAEVINLGSCKTYQLEAVELKTKKPELFDKAQLKMSWKNEHLKPLENLELDTSSLFEGD